MYPVLLQLSLPAFVPRFLLVLALALGLTVLGLSFLIRERRPLFLSGVVAGVATALLFGLKSTWLSRVHVTVTPFGASLALSIALGWGLSLRSGSRAGVDSQRVIRCLAYALLGGFLGARLGYVSLCASPISAWREVSSFEAGGLFGYGAYLGAIAGASIGFGRHPCPRLRRWLDEETPLLLVMIGLTRLGCYLEGCDFGRPMDAGAPRLFRALGTYPRWNPTPDGSFSGSPAWLYHVVDFGLSTESTKSLATHPTQIYEAVFVLALAAAAVHMGRRKRFHGRVFLVMALCFSAGRYLLEILRGDPDRGLITATAVGHWLRPRSWSQVFAAASVLATLVVWQKWRNVSAPAGARTGDK